MITTDSSQDKGHSKSSECLCKEDGYGISRTLCQIHGSGSQDSIDKIISDICADVQAGCTAESLCKHCVEDKKRLLAWHNTQLKLAIPEKQDIEAFSEHQSYRLSSQPLIDKGYNRAIDDMQSNLEEQGHE